MVARKPHPQEPDNPKRCVFVPLANDSGRGAWIPLLGPDGYRLDEVDAARVCVAECQRAWRTIEQLARRLRVFTEHPAFATFSTESIDAQMIADSARELAIAVQRADVDIARLLDEPGQDDIIRIGGVLHGVDEDSYQLVPLDELGTPEP